jgi:hypothetical protein
LKAEPPSCLREFKRVANPDRIQYQAKDEVEPEYINYNLENKVETMNCLQAERVVCNEHNVSEEKNASECDIVYLHYANEQNLGSCPQVKFLIGSHQYSANLDTGCEASILSELLYNELKLNGV